MEESGAKTQVKRRLTESNQEPKSSKQVCHICNDKSKMLNCVVCSNPACNQHSLVTGVQSQSRICDICYKEESAKAFTNEFIEREKLAHEISLLAEQRDSNTQTLNKSSGKIRMLEKEIQDKENAFKARVSELEKMIQERKLEIKLKSENLPGMQKETIDNRMQTETEKQKFSRINEELKDKRAQMDILVKERTTLVGELNEISDFIRSHVPVKILRQTLCNQCYQQVRHAFVQMFKPVVQIKDEMQGRASTKNMPERKGVCTNCGVF